MKETKHFKSLDSIRGIAALIVVIAHHKILFLSSYLYNTDSPFKIFIAATNSVALFFLLSGFVLTHSIVNSTYNYKVYLLKRFTRLYIPYIVSLIFALIAYKFFFESNTIIEDKWFFNTWNNINIYDIIHHVIFIGSYENYKINPVYWSLIIEIRISLVLPLLVYLIYYFNKLVMTLLILVISFLMLLIDYILRKYTIDLGDWLLTFQYLSCFLVGVLLYKFKDYFHSVYKSLSVVLKYILLLVSLILFTYSLDIVEIIGLKPTMYFSFILSSIASGILIYLSLFSKIMNSLLHIKLIQFIGKISYSLYLYHCIVLFTMINLFYDNKNSIQILFMSISISFLISYISYKYVEIKLTKKVNNKVLNKC